MEKLTDERWKTLKPGDEVRVRKDCNSTYVVEGPMTLDQIAQALTDEQIVAAVDTFVRSFWGQSLSNDLRVVSRAEAAAAMRQSILDTLRAVEPTEAELLEAAVEDIKAGRITPLSQVDQELAALPARGAAPMKGPVVR